MTLPVLTLVDSAEDRQRAHDLLAAIERADGAAPVSDQALLAASQGTRDLLLITVASAPIGVGVLGDGELDLALTPEARTLEIEAHALGLLLERTNTELRFWVHGDRPDTEAALAAAGFTPVRSLFRMVLDPDLLPAHGTPALQLPAPAGFTLRAYGTAPGDDAAWVAANAAAFASHPEQGRITVADFAQLRREPWFASEDLLLLDAGTELAGSTWVKTLRSDKAVDCELYAVGVRPGYSGRGLGRFLLEATLARMAEHAPRSVSLYVDGDNTAAVGLYVSAGFTVDSRSRQWLRPVSGAAGARMDA